MAFVQNAWKHIFGGGGSKRESVVTPEGSSVGKVDSITTRKPSGGGIRGGGLTTANVSPKEVLGTADPTLGNTPTTPNTSNKKPAVAKEPKAPITGGPTSFGGKKKKPKPFSTSARRPISSSLITRSLLGGAPA
jgi:hypothetical protein